MNGRFMIQKTKAERQPDEHRAIARNRVALDKRITSSDTDRQNRIDAYAERASLGLPLFA